MDAYISAIDHPPSPHPPSSTVRNFWCIFLTPSLPTVWTSYVWSLTLSHWAQAMKKSWRAPNFSSTLALWLKSIPTCFKPYTQTCWDSQQNKNESFGAVPAEVSQLFSHSLFGIDEILVTNLQPSLYWRIIQGRSWDHDKQVRTSFLRKRTKVKL